jgi:hypothetical protein
MLRRKTEWAEEMLDGGVEGPARGTFLRREARGEDASSDEPDERTAGDGAQADGEGTDDAAPHTVMPGDERGAADQQRTDDGHGYAGQGAPGQPGTA